MPSDRGMIYLIGGAIGFTTQGSTGQSVPVARIDSEPNQLLAARPISLALPPGSTVVRSGTEDRTIEIKTKHSYIRVRIALQGGVPFQPADPLGRHIISLLNLANTSSLWVHAFAIELDTGQFPLGRFSKQAKLEATWLNGVQSRLDRDFSWNRLRETLGR